MPDDVVTHLPPCALGKTNTVEHTAPEDLPNLRVGTIVSVSVRPFATKYKAQLCIDFGSYIGERAASVTFPQVVCERTLLGSQVIAIFPTENDTSKQRSIGLHVLGFTDARGTLALARPERFVAPGKLLNKKKDLLHGEH